MNRVKAVVLTLLLSACGLSPALNHTVPVRNAPQNQNDQPDGTTGSSRGGSQSGDAYDCHVLLPSEKLCFNIKAKKAWEVFTDSPFEIRIWTQGVPIGKDGPFIDPVQGAAYADIWMASMGHPGRGKVIIEKIATGYYLAKNVLFSMGGEWWIRLNIRRADGSFVEPTGSAFPHRTLQLQD
jgi:hypothetical protein